MSADVTPIAAAVHESTLVLDAHADIVIAKTGAMYLDPDGSSKVAPSKLRAGGVDAIVMSLAVGPGPRTAEGDASARREAGAKLDTVMSLIDEHDDIVLATSADEVVEARRVGKMAFLIGFQNARILGGDVSRLDHFYDAGARVFALTHMGHNDFADSSRPMYDGTTGTYEPDAEHGGLSALGVAAIERINELGAVVDVSQLSREATLQVLELSTAPVVASHSLVKAISDVRRNLSDDEIDRIGDNGGVVHISAFQANMLDFREPDMLKGIRAARSEAGLPVEFDYPYELYWEIRDKAVQATFLQTTSELISVASVTHIVDHIDHVVNRLGVEHVGFGSDFNHGSGIVQGFHNSSESPNLTSALVDRGYTAEDIGKIWSGNFLRVLRAAATT